MLKMRKSVLLLGFATLVGLVLWGLDAAGYCLRLEPKAGQPTATTLDFSAELGLGAPAPAGGTQARSLVLMIADGMGQAQLAAARMVLGGPNRRLFVETFPVTGWTFTHSAREITTDSAAGATALATGFKTHPGRLSVDPQGHRLTTLFEKARAAGKATGLLTDSYLVDATPAAFVVHSESRRDYLAIAQEMLASGTDMLLGTSDARLERLSGWAPLLASSATAGYRRIDGVEALRNTEPGVPVLGIFPQGSMVEPTRQHELAALAEAAVERLRRDPDGFVLLVETEETDTHSHGADLDRMARGVASLDEAARRILSLVGGDGQTLVVITADHETGGLALLGGEPGKPLSVAWASTDHTAEPVPRLAAGPGAERLGGVRDNAEVGRLLAEILGLEPGAP